MTILHIPSWFPNPQKPLDGNFILRQIAAVAPHTRSIVLHHTEPAFKGELASLLDDAVIFYPIDNVSKHSRWALFRAYDKAFRDIVRQYGKPDIIHLHVALPMGPLAAWLSIRYRIPLIISEHWSVYQPQNRHQLTRFQRLQLWFTYRRAALLTTVSEDLHHAISDTVGPARKVPWQHINNVVDTDLFTPGPSLLPDDGLYHILHVSSLEDVSKNVMGILRAVCKLRDVRQDFVLDIIHDLQNIEVEHFIEENKMGDYVRLLGKMDSAGVAEHVRRCAFMLQFSNYENQPCVLIEAFAAGKPVLATRAGGIPEIVIPSRGRLVAPKDEESLLEQLQYMLDHSRDFDGTAIRDYAVRNFSVETIGREFLRQYERILSAFVLKKNNSD
ncbi:MAG: glycosyltransferase [Bacteroidales bacterium]|nr:glycosyltransferase [Bacteroidales bacterium]